VTGLAKSVTILGSTGTIGQQTLEVLDSLQGEYAVIALAAGKNAELLSRQIRRFRPNYVCVQDEQVRDILITLLADVSPLPEIWIGEDGLRRIAEVPSDIVVSSIVGARGLLPTWNAIRRGATVLLANKETLVAAGDLVMKEVENARALLLPVDSEHSALFQCLHGSKPDEVNRYILTASGGPFRSLSEDELRHVTAEQALRHPNWSMGKKITVDSATLMNKGLEVIEAHHLFNASYDKIEVVVHPQSVVHSMIEYKDGSVLAQLATPDMKLPIQYALTYPNRVASKWPKLNLLECSQLTFEAPDIQRFRSLALAYAAGRQGGYAPCVLNAANEVAVDAFLQGKISFLAIPSIVETVLEEHTHGVPTSVDDILAMDSWARRQTEAVIRRGGWSP
jgi:1-deoxy-D-xylulose-5-phosphate reductoisomerase